MTLRQTTTWVSAGIGSFVLHIAALVGFGFLTDPEPVEDQTLPQSQINIQAHEVKRVDAHPEAAPSEQLSEIAANAPAAVQGAVPQSKAKAVTAQSTVAPAQTLNSAQLTAAQPEAPVTVAATAHTEIVTSAALQPQSVPPSNIPQNTTPALSTPVQAATVLAAFPTATVAATVIAPTQTTTEVLPVSTQRAAALTLPTVEMAEAPPVETTNPSALPKTSLALANVANQTKNAAALPLPVVASKAALAWSGDGQEQIESASLAAIQAFMRPGDLDSSDSDIGDVRDGISAILASVPCARLQTTFIPETGQLELRGHVPEDALRGPVLAALREQVGDAIPVSDQLLILPRPQCGALSGIADVGLPQSTEQLTNPRVIGADGFAQNYTYFNGQRLELELAAPDYDGFVYVDFFTADGNVIHLQPNTIVPLEFAPAKSALSVGKDRGDKPSLDITVSPPFGQEIAAAFATSIPLYQGLRPLQEPAEPYLKFLKQQVATARASDPTFKGEWVYFFISTKED